MDLQVLVSESTGNMVLGVFDRDIISLAVAI